MFKSIYVCSMDINPRKFIYIPDCDIFFSGSNTYLLKLIVTFIGPSLQTAVDSSSKEWEIYTIYRQGS